MCDRKKKQLGMNPSTASHRLVKDILWKFIKDTGNNICFQCQGAMDRENFSIEHKEPWLDSDDPQGLFFNLDNISFSHISCNISSARRPHKKYQNKEEKNKGMAELARASWSKLTKEEQKKRRRDKYLKYGV